MEECKDLATVEVLCRQMPKFDKNVEGVVRQTNPSRLCYYKSSTDPFANFDLVVLP